MARPVWQGALSLGLVTVPVAMYTATEDHSVPFRQIERGTSDRIKLQRVNERTGQEVDYSDVAKGYETSGEIVEVEQEELAEIAPGRSRALEIDTFVDVEAIDPVYYDKSYWLAPKDADYAHAYHLLRRAMADTGLAGVAMLVMRGRQHLTAIRAGEEIMVLHTMRFADEVRDFHQQITDLPSADKPKRKELDMATELIRTMSGSWDPKTYEDTYQKKVRELVRAKEAGKKPKRAKEAAEPTKVIDLTDALERSMKQAGRGSGRARGRGKSAADLSKSELDTMARKLKIKGRSGMTKDELAAAIAASEKKAAS
jgi:DNA end-binding protein Ku